MDFKWNISGLEECNELLKKLPDDLARKSGESAMRAGGNFLKKIAQEKAPKDEGDLAESIVVRKRKNTGPGLVGYALLVLSSHGHLIEWGAKAHKILAGQHRNRKTNKKVLSDGTTMFGKEVQHPGIKAQPFIRPTIDENQDAFVDKVREVLARAIASNAFKFTGRKK